MLHYFSIMAETIVERWQKRLLKLADSWYDDCVSTIEESLPTAGETIHVFIKEFTDDGYEVDPLDANVVNEVIGRLEKLGLKAEFKDPDRYHRTTFVISLPDDAIPFNSVENPKETIEKMWKHRHTEMTNALYNGCVDQIIKKIPVSGDKVMVHIHEIENKRPKIGWPRSVIVAVEKKLLDLNLNVKYWFTDDSWNNKRFDLSSEEWKDSDSWGYYEVSLP